MELYKKTHENIGNYLKVEIDKRYSYLIVNSLADSIKYQRWYIIHVKKKVKYIYDLDHVQVINKCCEIDQVFKETVDLYKWWIEENNMPDVANVFNKEFKFYRPRFKKAS